MDKTEIKLAVLQGVVSWLICDLSKITGTPIQQMHQRFVDMFQQGLPDGQLAESLVSEIDTLFSGAAIQEQSGRSWRNQQP